MLMMLLILTRWPRSCHAVQLLRIAVRVPRHRHAMPMTGRSQH